MLRCWVSEGALTQGEKEKEGKTRFAAVLPRTGVPIADAEAATTEVAVSATMTIAGVECPRISENPLGGLPKVV